MTFASLALAEGVPLATALAVFGFALVSLAVLGFELRRREGAARWVLLSGIVALGCVAGAILRPARVVTRGVRVGAKVVVLVDESRRLLLPSDGRTRRELALEAARATAKHFASARVSVFGFGEGGLRPLIVDEALAHPSARELSDETDLTGALAALGQEPGERPKAIVVVSDGRLSRPGEKFDEAALREASRDLGARIDTVRVTDQAPRDASIRSIRTAGATVAHQPLALTVEIACSGGLTCGDVPVTLRELRHGVEPFVLATGVAKVKGDSATVELSITLERAGERLVEVAIEPPEGDTIVENNTRILSFAVTRDRLRLLHVAGRPTYDVRALRMWLKSDESVDLVAFFILRTDEDNTETSDDSELALIPFPVDELFTEHLPSFDAVILQDIDAVTYKLARHLPALENYVRSGGGLIMVGGPSAFAGGGYAHSPLERVLPVELRTDERPFDTADFVPQYTEAGRSAPVLRGLTELFGDELPTLSGSNTFGVARPGSIVLWEHPDRRAGSGPMPVLALGEAGDGRSIALGVDGTHELAFSEFAERAAGRAYGALWDGLVGWLMRDPRYEALRLELSGSCIAGLPASLRLSRLPGASGDVTLELEHLGQRSPLVTKSVKSPPPGPLDIDLGVLEPGGYSALRHMQNSGPLTEAMIVVLLLAVPGIALLIFLQKRGASFAERMAARFFPHLKQGTSFRAAIEELYDSPSRLAASAALHLIAWAGAGGGTFIAFRLVGGSISLVNAVALEALLCTIRSIAVFVPAAIGVQEAGYALLAPLFGLPAEMGLAVSLLKRAREIVLGVPALLYWQTVESRKMFTGVWAQP